MEKNIIKHKHMKEEMNAKKKRRKIDEIDYLPKKIDVS